MKLFDLHCDTITECRRQNRQLLKNDGHIDIARASALDKWIEVFAVWMPDEYRGAAAEEYFNDIYNCFDEQTKLNSDSITRIAGHDDLLKCAAGEKNGAILSAEGGSALAGSIERLHLLYSLGVRLITLTWNAKNELACGCMEETDEGLTDFGRQVVREMNRLPMTVDVSHLGRKGFWDCAELTDVPFIASHSTCTRVLEKTRADSKDKERSIRRNLDDDQIKLIIERGGIIGVNFCRSFLGDRGDDGAEAVLRHIWHILELGGEDNIALGSDYDGCGINDEICGIDKMTFLFEYLRKNGIKSDLCEKIFFDNAFKFFENML